MYWFRNGKDIFQAVFGKKSLKMSVLYWRVPYICKILSKNEQKVEFKETFNENLARQQIILKRFEENMKIRNEKNNLTNEPCDPVDPLSFVVVKNRIG